MIVTLPAARVVELCQISGSVITRTSLDVVIDASEIVIVVEPAVNVPVNFVGITSLIAPTTVFDVVFNPAKFCDVFAKFPRSEDKQYSDSSPFAI